MTRLDRLLRAGIVVSGLVALLAWLTMHPLRAEIDEGPAKLP